MSSISGLQISAFWTYCFASFIFLFFFYHLGKRGISIYKRMGFVSRRTKRTSKPKESISSKEKNSASNTLERDEALKALLVELLVRVKSVEEEQLKVTQLIKESTSFVKNINDF